MSEIDKQFLETPFYGTRRMTIALQRMGYAVNRKRVTRLMRHMGLVPIYPKPNLSESHPEHKKYSYLLRDLIIDRPDQVWAADITYIPLVGGFAYLVAIIDWHSRCVLEWELSNLLDTDFCLMALERGLSRSAPEIFNTDQGSQFTSNRWTERLQKAAVHISMDGRGRALDNVFIERVWRSVKYEDVYPRGYETIKEARLGLARYFDFYNCRRPHQGLGYRFPADVYNCR